VLLLLLDDVEVDCREYVDVEQADDDDGSHEDEVHVGYAGSLLSTSAGEESSPLVIVEVDEMPCPAHNSAEVVLYLSDVLSTGSKAGRIPIRGDS
jgi:hypothetical protein